MNVDNATIRYQCRQEIRASQFVLVRLRIIRDIIGADAYTDDRDHCLKRITRNRTTEHEHR